ncbi:MAG: MFS transporter [Bacteroidota bacterium]|nr:MFS transporter [Bacteroidota bacterium]
MKRVLPVIVLSQFFCTSLWFAGNAIISDIVKQFHLEPAYLAHLASAVQSGFIAGTLIFAVLSISDRFSPSLVFFLSSLVAALFNLAISFNGINSSWLLLFRFLTGFFLAGIYPVGMKIAADYYQQGLGKSLGFLVGALVIGTSFPHLLKSITAALPWKWVIFSTSFLSVMGGLAMLLWIPDGPYRKAGQPLNPGAFLKGFRDKKFRAVSFGYFGHMWELYAFWVFVPVILTAYKDHYPGAGFNIPFLSFLIIAAGGVSCVLSGLISQWLGAKKTASIALLISCACCIISPLLLFNRSEPALIVFLFTWSMAVIADSPLFSTLVAQNAPPVSKGASLTIVNCIGFSITIISIQLINALRTEDNARYIYMLLAIGPVLGLIALTRDKDNHPKHPEAVK